MSEEYKMQRIKEYLIFHIKDSKEQRELLDYKNQLQQKENIIKEVREYIKSNEKEYGSLEDNEKIILRILDKEVISNEWRRICRRII